MTSPCDVSDADRQSLAIIRCSVAGVCVVICLIALVLMCIFMKWRLFLHRILTYFTIATLAYLFVYVVQVIAVWADDDNFVKECKAAGFFNQLTSWLHLEFTLWMALYILYLNCHDLFHPDGDVPLWEPPKLGEGIVLAVIVVVALVFSLIPVSAYGLTGGWCWIQERRGNENGECVDYLPGKIEQWVLWWVWLLLAAIFIAVLLVVASFLTYKMSQNYRRANEFFKKRAQQMVLVLFLYLSVYFIFTIAEVSIRIANSATSEFHYGTWATVAVISPIGAVFLPVMFLIHLWCVGRYTKELDVPGERTPITAPLV